MKLVTWTSTDLEILRGVGGIDSFRTPEEWSDSGPEYSNKEQEQCPKKGGKNMIDSQKRHNFKFVARPGIREAEGAGLFLGDTVGNGGRPVCLAANKK